MKRLIAASALCLALLLGSMWSVHAVQETTQAVICDIENDHLTEARAAWDRAQTLLGALLLHDEIEQADRLFDRVTAARKNGNEEEFLLDRAELLARLRHLPDLQKPSLKNLL